MSYLNRLNLIQFEYMTISSEFLPFLTTWWACEKVQEWVPEDVLWSATGINLPNTPERNIMQAKMFRIDGISLRAFLIFLA